MAHTSILASWFQSQQQFMLQSIRARSLLKITYNSLIIFYQKRGENKTIKCLIKFELPFLFLPFHSFRLLWFSDSSLIIKSDPLGNQHNYNGTKNQTKKVDCTHAVNNGSRKHHQQKREREGGGKCWNIHGILPHTRGQFARSYFFLPCMFSKALHYIFIRVSLLLLIIPMVSILLFSHTGE